MRLTGRAKGIMIQGTGSGVGKSLITVAFLRIMKEEGKRPAPFKSQNMALNSYITSQGKEIGYAQALQAFAAGAEPSEDMNPVLLKPSGEGISQLIIHGRPVANMTAKEYYGFKDEAWKHVISSYERLSGIHDFIVAEGAGSPAEINLAEFDICNMKVAELGDMPVILVADIDKGGVFAQIYGTLMLLSEVQRKRIFGIIINKFRGDYSILKPGIEQIEQLTGKPVLGVLPYMNNLCLEDEDGTVIERDKIKKGKHKNEALPRIGIIRLPHISNFTDFLPLEAEVNVEYIFEGGSVSGFDCIIIPGTKNTINDLEYLKSSGLAGMLLSEHMKNKTILFGICGGYQMLGRFISDPHGVEGSPGECKGLNLLNIKTVLEREKVTRQVKFYEASDIFGIKGEMAGYEIHMGRTETTGGSNIIPLFKTGDGIPEGAAGPSMRIFGTYIHGLFANDNFRAAFYKKIYEGKKEKETGDITSYNIRRETSINRIADMVRKNIDLEPVFALI